MEMRSILLNPEEGYPFGVIAGPSLFGRDELHGPFDTKEEAHKYGLGLMQKFEDYTHISVVKIEVPHVQTVLGVMSLSTEKGEP